MNYVPYAMAALSCLALLLYAIDKLLSVCHAVRIPEAFLLGLGFFGGAAGALLGMLFFRHKTRHGSFWFFNFLGLAWQIAFLIFARQNGLIG